MMSQRAVYAVLLGTACWFGPTAVHADDANDDFSHRSTWQAPSAAHVQAQVTAWFATLEADAPTQREFDQLWTTSSEPLSPDALLNRVVASIGLGNQSVNALLRQLRKPVRMYQLPDHSVLDDESLPAWARHNLRLYFAQWLSDREYYNEALDQLESLTPADVVDPAALLFYQSVAFHRLLDKDRCIPTLETLLENESTIPRRYATTAKLMMSDISPMKPDSLDEISRLMDNIRVRLGHGRAGKRVRKEEDDVIAKLDKMIEDLEQQAQQGGAAASGSQGNNRPAAPMEDSVPAGGLGPGNVDPKELGSRTDWGNLPPKEREQALQKLAEDLPSHYRDVIEEYFRKLAKDEVPQ